MGQHQLFPDLVQIVLHGVGHALGNMEALLLEYALRKSLVFMIITDATDLDSMWNVRILILKIVENPCLSTWFAAQGM